MDLITTNPLLKILNIIKISLIFIITELITGCIPDTAYYADHGDSFVALDTQFRVNSLNYPIFRAKEKYNFSKEILEGKYPSISPEHIWLVTHEVNGRYLIYSEEYDREHCIFNRKLSEKSEEICQPGQNGESSNIYIYILMAVLIHYSIFATQSAGYSRQIKRLGFI